MKRYAQLGMLAALLIVCAADSVGAEGDWAA